MKKSFSKILYVLYLVIAFASCKEDRKVSISTLAINCPISLYNVSEMKVTRDGLFIKSEIEHGYGQQVLSLFNIDIDNKRLIFQKECFKRDSDTYSFYFFTPLWDDNDNLLIVESDNPVLWSQVNDSAVLTGKSLLSTSAIVPYEMALNVRNAFYVSENEYVFVGKQYGDGKGAIYRSVINNNKTEVTEIVSLVADERYPSWVVNHGSLTYNNSIKKGAFAYLMFPEIKLFDYANNTERTINLGESTFKAETVEKGDVWYMNIVHFKDIISTDDYIYALYWGMSYQDVDKGCKDGTACSRICKFNWNGEFVNSYKIKKPLRTIAVTEDGHGLVGYDGLNFTLITF